MIGSMLRSLFLPTSVNSYYLFTQRIVAGEITPTAVRMTLVSAQGKTRTVIKVVHTRIPDTSESFDDRVVEALTQAITEIGAYDVYYSVLPANAVIFKELTLPFTNLKKIKLVLPFEIEPLLPFSLADATIDAIVTQQTPTESTVYVAALKNELFAAHLELLARANIDPAKVTVDLFELYALYRAMNAVPSESTDIIMYVGYNALRIAIVTGGKLVATRYIPEGLYTLATALDTNIEHLERFGIAESVTVAAMSALQSDVQLTLDAFRERYPNISFNRVLLAGPGVDIKGLDTVLTKITGAECGTMTPQSVQHAGLFKTSAPSIPNSALITLAAALSLPLTAEFNLDVSQVHEEEYTQTRNQLITLLVLVAASVGLLVVRGFITSRRFNNEIRESEKEAVNRLKKEFPSLSKLVTSSSLEALKKRANLELVREKNIWFALSPQNRASYLTYLKALSEKLDPVGLGLVINKMVLDDTSLTIEGRVRDFEALARFEEDLRRLDLFTTVPQFETIKFVKKLPLKRTFEEVS